MRKQLLAYSEANISQPPAQVRSGALFFWRSLCSDENVGNLASIIVGALLKKVSDAMGVCFFSSHRVRADLIRLGM